MTWHLFDFFCVFWPSGLLSFFLYYAYVYLYYILFSTICSVLSFQWKPFIWSNDVNKNQTGTGRLECLFADNKSSRPKRKPTFCISIRVRRTLHCTCVHLAAVGQSTTMCILTPRLCYFLQWSLKMFFFLQLCKDCAEGSQNTLTYILKKMEK